MSILRHARVALSNLGVKGHFKGRRCSYEMTKVFTIEICGRLLALDHLSFSYKRPQQNASHTCHFEAQKRIGKKKRKAIQEKKKTMFNCTIGMPH